MQGAGLSMGTTGEASGRRGRLDPVRWSYPYLAGGVEEERGGSGNPREGALV